MKVKNIVFSGFMAAIMMSVAGNASAAVQIASKAYVDDLEKTVNETFENYTTTEQLGNVINQNITQILEDTTTDGSLGKTVNDLETSVGALETAVGDANSGLTKNVADAAAAAAAAKTAADNAQSDVNDLADVVNSTTNGLATKASQSDLDTLAGKVNNETTGLDSKASQSDLTALDGRVTKNENDIKSLNEGLDKKVADSIANALTGEGDIKESIDNAISTAIGDLPIGTLTSDVDNLKSTVGDASDGLVKDVADNKSAIDTLNGGVNDAGSVKNTVAGMTVPKPTIDCGEGKMCVLSIGTDGNPVWVDVTQPYDAE